MQKQQWEAQLAQTQSQCVQLRRKNSADCRSSLRFVFNRSVVFFSNCRRPDGLSIHLYPKPGRILSGNAGASKNNRLYLEAQARSEVLGRCLSRLDSRWQQASETGAEFLTDDQPALADLDVFGPAFVISVLLYGGPATGKTALASYFKEPAAAKIIRERQETVTVLAQNPDFMLADWTCTHGLTPQTAAAMASEKLNELVQPITLPIPGWFIRWMPAVTLTLLGLTLLRWISPLCFILIFLSRRRSPCFPLVCPQPPAGRRERSGRDCKTAWSVVRNWISRRCPAL